MTKSRVRDDNVIGAISLDDQLCMIHCVRAGSVCHRSAPKYYDFKILSMFPINKSVATLATLFLRCGYLKKKKVLKHATFTSDRSLFNEWNEDLTVAI